MKWGKRIEASYTVEASLVMSVTVFFLAALLTGVFQIHSRVTGQFILQETLERCVSWEGNTPGKEEPVTDGYVEEQLDRLRGFFWCGRSRMSAEESAEAFEGWVDTGTETEIRVKKYNPEGKLRLFRAFGV